jgi:calnexin
VGQLFFFFESCGHFLAVTLLKMLFFAVLVACCMMAVTISAAGVRDRLFFVETFDSDPFVSRRWVKSTFPKYVDSDANSTEYPAIRVGPSTAAAKGLEHDNALRFTKEKKHYGIAAKFPKPLTFGADKGHKELVIQYEVKLEETLNCGGAYIKLLRDTPDLDVANLNGDTPYTIMFGPDKCGTVNKVHFILQHQNPLTGAWEEKHSNETAAQKGDKKTHLYTLNIKSDNSYEVYVDKKLSKHGNLLTHMKPSINPPKEIDDPTDAKPADWADEAMMDDPTAVKPDDWDENAPKEIEDEKAKKPEGWLDEGPEKVPDPKAVKPVDWDDEEDGVWEAPLIANPACEKIGCGEWKRPKIKNPNYKGKWKRPKVANPAYKGPWKARQLPNPDYFEDASPAQNVAPMGALAIEVWTINAGIVFDNFAIAHSLADAFAFADETFTVKQTAEGVKEKKESKAKKEAGRADKKKNGTTKDKAVIFVTEVIETVFEMFETNPIAAGTSVIAAVLALALLCWPSSKPKRRPVRPVEEPDLTEPKDSSETKESTATTTTTEGAKDDQSPKDDSGDKVGGKPTKKSE